MNIVFQEQMGKKKKQQKPTEAVAKGIKEL